MYQFLQFGHIPPQVKQHLIKYLSLTLETLFTLRLHATQQCREFRHGLNWQIPPKNFSGYLTVGFDNGDLFCDIFQLTDITWPGIRHEQLLGILHQLNGWHTVFFGKICSELTEQKRNIIRAFTQCRYFNRHRIQTIVQVFTETSVRYGFRKIHIRGCHNPDIRFLHLGRADLYIFSAFKHTKQAGLSRKRKFTHLIQKDGAAISLSKISVTVADGTGKCPFLMTKQFGIDRTLWNRSTVYRNIRSVFSPAKLMDYLRKAFLTDSTFSRHQHGQVCRSHLNSHINGTVQSFTIAYDAKTKFYILYL